MVARPVSCIFGFIRAPRVFSLVHHESARKATPAHAGRRNDEQEKDGNGEKKAGQVVVAAYITQTNFLDEQGVSVETGWELSPPPPAASPDFKALARAGEDRNWMRMRMPEWHHYNRIKHLDILEYYVPCFAKTVEKKNRNVMDMWLRFPDGKEKFTDERLG